MCGGGVTREKGIGSADFQRFSRSAIAGLCVGIFVLIGEDLRFRNVAFFLSPHRDTYHQILSQKHRRIMVLAVFAWISYTWG